jgi:hypothetical protein
MNNFHAVHLLGELMRSSSCASITFQWFYQIAMVHPGSFSLLAAPWLTKTYNADHL